MTKMTTITRTNLAALEKDIEEALKAVAEKYGLAVKCGGGRFSPSTFVPKIEFATVSDSGEAQSSEVRDFKMYAAMFGLQPDDLGKTFRTVNGEYRICGLRTKARTRPIIASKDGKQYIFAAEQVKFALQRQA